MLKVLADLLFKSPELNIYAVIDGAAMEELLDYLEGLRPEYACLYRGELPPGVEHVAPYLVRLEPGSRFLQWLLETAWDNHAAIFLVSDQAMTSMRLHLRRHLRVVLEDGSHRIFRYYDPRVFRVFAPTLLPKESAEFFGPVLRFICEGRQSGTADSFRLDASQLIHESMVLEPGAEWKIVPNVEAA